MHKAWLPSERTDFTCDLKKHVPRALCFFHFTHNVVFTLKFQVAPKEGQEVSIFLKRETGSGI